MLRNLTDLTPAALAVVEFAIAQGEIVEKLRQHGAINQRKKRDGSVVTDGDTTIHQAAKTALPKIINLPVCSEEDETPTPHGNEYWLIDPIDGTRSYCNNAHDSYAISIALIRNCRPVLGVVVGPAIHTAYVAELGKGCWKLELPTGHIAKLGFHFTGTPLFAGYRNRTAGQERDLQRFLKQNGMMPHDVIPESSLLKFCYVADGRYAYGGSWEWFNDWDIAAADLIVHEAGGRFVNARTGKRFEYIGAGCELNSPLAVAKGVTAHLATGDNQ